jgi:hypothetical protein
MGALTSAMLMSMALLATITVAMGQNMSVATMVYPLVAIMLFYSSVFHMPSTSHQTTS